ncbi:hypothetical protein [Streptacidiphilus sp. PB12-B1b]|uniref:hypothetical protein n=1 Tax=Streptacidiphilus sp. PB12-B1b TaxID=2705012 RepID=UPI001CDD3B82|nr:hypothetical protein [Streptacidiphilus sp. PB12-B1b]
MPELDPALAARLRAEADARVAEQVQAARVRAADKRTVRQAFARNRDAGVQHRNAARAARVRLAEHHNTKETTVTTTDVDRDRIAQEAAEYIANVLIPESDKTQALPGVSVYYTDDKRPPRTVADIKATLLEGRFWISWIGDERVAAAMRAIHGQPVGDAEWLAGDHGLDTAS